MKERINNYIYNLSTEKKMEKYHFIYKNTIDFINQNDIDDILIVYNNVNDVDCLAIIDELLTLKKNIYVLYFNKKYFKWNIEIQKINELNELNSFLNLKYTLNKSNNNVDVNNIKNILLCIDNYNNDKKITEIKYDSIFNVIGKMKFNYKIGLCYDVVFEYNTESTNNSFNLDTIITEKRIIL